MAIFRAAKVGVHRRQPGSSCLGARAIARLAETTS